MGFIQVFYLKNGGNGATDGNVPAPFCMKRKSVTAGYRGKQQRDVSDDTQHHVKTLFRFLFIFRLLQRAEPVIQFLPQLIDPELFQR
ncbi:hypothetical protein EDC54_109110 [Samsonia erythrinae]|uniref:Uncharacterized protein n=1 Tax=Samsonia erythrinae TaxID=160434 RepID=A0A4V2VT41_9GAMM|nr:hypothetical protein EDC54_109110 [Samsonia erythrinae]